MHCTQADCIGCFGSECYDARSNGCYKLDGTYCGDAMATCYTDHAGGAAPSRPMPNRKNNIRRNSSRLNDSSISGIGNNGKPGIKSSQRRVRRKPMIPKPGNRPETIARRSPIVGQVVPIFWEVSPIAYGITVFHMKIYNRPSWSEDYFPGAPGNYWCGIPSAGNTPVDINVGWGGPCHITPTEFWWDSGWLYASGIGPDTPSTLSTGNCLKPNPGGNIEKPQNVIDGNPGGDSNPLNAPDCFTTDWALFDDTQNYPSGFNSNNINQPYSDMNTSWLLPYVYGEGFYPCYSDNNGSWSQEAFIQLAQENGQNPDDFYRSTTYPSSEGLCVMDDMVYDSTINPFIQDSYIHPSQYNSSYGTSVGTYMHPGVNGVVYEPLTSYVNEDAEAYGINNVPYVSRGYYFTGPIKFRNNLGNQNIGVIR